MNKAALTQVFFSLLRLSSGQEEKDFPVLSEQEWAAIYELSLRQSVIGVVFGGIDRLPNDRWPDKIMSMKFYAQVKYIRNYSAQAAEASAAAVERFAREGKRSVILKGSAVSSLYDNPELRSCGDVDIWIESERRWLIKFCRSINGASRVFYHHIPFAKMRGVEIEAHLTPSWMYNPFTNARLQKWFSTFWKDDSNICTVSCCGQNLPAMSPAFNRVFLLSHVFRHLFMDGIGIRQIMDYYYLLRSGCTEEEKAETMALFRKLNMAAFAGAVMWVLQEVFHLPDENLLTAPDRRRGEFLLREILRSGNFGQYDDRATGSNNGSDFVNFFVRTFRSLRFLRQYPGEALWLPYFKIWHYCYRLIVNKI